MVIDYFGHPFSSYTWKGEIALIEKGADYRLRNVDPVEPDNGAVLAQQLAQADVVEVAVIPALADTHAPR